MRLSAEPQSILRIGPRLWLVLLMVQLSNMLFGMTITIANVVLPEIRGTMSASQDEISWAITLNLVATAVATPLTAWVAGRIGKRALMVGTLTGFSVCSLFCGLSSSLDSLILYRIGQGIFGAPIMPLGQAIVLAMFPRHLQPTAIVLWGVGAVFGPVLGPIIGAYMADVYSWRAAFFVIVPAGLLATVCAWFALANDQDKRTVQFDWIGFLALSVSIIAAQLILDRGEKLGWLDSMEITLLAFLGVIAFWIFVTHCLTAERPFLDPRLLLDRNFALGTIIAFVMGTLTFTSLVLFPTLLHDLRGYPDRAIGIILASRGVGNWAAFLFVIPMARLIPRISLGLGLLLQAAAGYAIAQFDINMNDFDVAWTNFLLGFGQSIAFTPMTILAFTTLSKDKLTEGSAVFTLMRNFGSSLFISMAVMVMLRSTSGNYAAMTEFASAFASQTLTPLPSPWSISTQMGLASLSDEIKRQASMIGYINAFYLMAWTAAAAAPLAFFMRNPTK